MSSDEIDPKDFVFVILFFGFLITMLMFVAGYSIVIQSNDEA